MGKLVGFLLLCFAVVGIVVVLRSFIARDETSAPSVGSADQTTINANATIISQQATIQAFQRAPVQGGQAQVIPTPTPMPVPALTGPTLTPVQVSGQGSRVITTVDQPTPPVVIVQGGVQPQQASSCSSQPLDSYNFAPQPNQSFTLPSGPKWDGKWIVLLWWTNIAATGQEQRRYLLSPSDPRSFGTWKGGAAWSFDCEPVARNDYSHHSEPEVRPF